MNIVFRLSDNSDVHALLGARTSTTDGFMLFNYRTTNSISLDTKGGTTRKVLGDRLSANTNYNLTVTFSGGTAKLYLNGVLNNTTTYTPANLNYPLTVFTAGARTNTLGNIYSVKIYNRVLTDSEIIQNYNIDKDKYGI